MGKGKMEGKMGSNGCEDRFRQLLLLEIVSHNLQINNWNKSRGKENPI